MGSAATIRRTVSRNVSSTPIYDELAATYLADVDLGGSARPEPAADLPAGPSAPADPQPGKRAKA